MSSMQAGAKAHVAELTAQRAALQERLTALELGEAPVGDASGLQAALLSSQREATAHAQQQLQLQRAELEAVHSCHARELEMQHAAARTEQQGTYRRELQQKELETMKSKLVTLRQELQHSKGSLAKATAAITMQGSQAQHRRQVAPSPLCPYTFKGTPSFPSNITRECPPSSLLILQGNAPRLPF